jgi:hypothetical protein
MTLLNGHASACGESRVDAGGEGVSAPVGRQFTPREIKEVVAELEVPFALSVIDWRVTNTYKENGKSHGQVIPYADQRAYSDRLNALFTPAGWTRKYAVHTSANFQRGRDEKIVAKVFVTCDLTIFGLGSHSATGEEWADNDNAGTAAEAQAFKRACCCFGLGRYLYYFSGVWMDLDERKRPKTTPRLVGWATPEGWRKGLRPDREENQRSTNGYSGKVAGDLEVHRSGKSRQSERDELIREIETMAEPLGKGLYRGLLKNVARAWRPSEIHEISLLKKLRAHMQSADRGLRRLEAALEQAGPEALTSILRSLDINSRCQINNLETLHEIVVVLEAKAKCERIDLC